MGDSIHREECLPMKKKTIGLLLLAFTMAFTAGCANNTAGGGTESASSTEQEAAIENPYSDQIDYDASKYVTLGDYKGLEVTVEGDYDVTDADVREEVELEISMMGEDYRTPNREIIEDGDQVNVDYVGTIDGEVFEGGTAQERDIVIGSGMMIDGFEDGLIGKKVGEVVELNLKFPEDYAKTDLAGKDVVFSVTINSLKEPVEVTYDTLTDDYIKSKTGMESVDEYLKEVRAAMEEEAQNAKEQNATYAVLEKLLEVCKVTGHPEGLEEERMEQEMQYYRDMASAQNVDLATMLSYYGMTEENLHEQIEEATSKNVDMELILQAIADKEGISKDEDAYQAYIKDVLSQGIFEDEDQLYSDFSKEYVRRQYCLDKARELVESSAVLKYEKSTDTQKGTEKETEKDTEKDTEKETETESEKE